MRTDPFTFSSQAQAPRASEPERPTGDRDKFDNMVRESASKYDRRDVRGRGRDALETEDKPLDDDKRRRSDRASDAFESDITGPKFEAKPTNDGSIEFVTAGRDAQVSASQGKWTAQGLSSDERTAEIGALVEDMPISQALALVPSQQVPSQFAPIEPTQGASLSSLANASLAPSDPVLNGQPRPLNTPVPGLSSPLDIDVTDLSLQQRPSSAPVLTRSDAGEIVAKVAAPLESIAQLGVTGKVDAKIVVPSALIDQSAAVVNKGTVGLVSDGQIQPLAQNFGIKGEQVSLSAQTQAANVSLANQTPLKAVQFNAAITAVQLQSSAGPKLGEPVQPVQTNNTAGNLNAAVAANAQSQLSGSVDPTLLQQTANLPQNASDAIVLPEEVLGRGGNAPIPQTLVRGVATSGAANQTAGQSAGTTSSNVVAGTPSAITPTSQGLIQPQSGDGLAVNQLLANQSLLRPDFVPQAPLANDFQIPLDAFVEGEGQLPETLQTTQTSVRADTAQTVQRLQPAQAAMVTAQVSQQMLDRMDGRTNRFEIRLDPPELGRVDVKVEVGADGKVMAVLAARDAAVADALMRGAKTLENVLAQAGFDLSDKGISVELDMPGGQAREQNERDPERPNHVGQATTDQDVNQTSASIQQVTTSRGLEVWSRNQLNLTA